MNIFFLTQWYPSSEAPVIGIFVREHALAHAEFHRVYVIHVKGRYPDLCDFPETRPVQDGLISTFVVKYHASKIPKTYWYNRIKALNKIYKYLLSRGIQPELIHANVYNTSDLTYLLQRRYHIPTVFIDKSSAFPRKPISTRHRLIRRYCMNKLLLIMPVSLNLATHIQMYGVHTPFEVIPNTVNIDIYYSGNVKLSSQDGIKRILVVAGLTKVKGIDYTMQTLALVKQRGKRFILLIAGDDPDRSELSDLADALGISADLIFLGNRSKPEVSELMRQADFLSLKSRWDNNPVVVLEAMATSIPVLAF